MARNKFISPNSGFTQSRAATDDLLQHGAPEHVMTEVYRREAPVVPHRRLGVFHLLLMSNASLYTGIRGRHPQVHIIKPKAYKKRKKYFP